MVLEQTYNTEVKQKQGLSGITLQPKAQMKWLYTKPIVAAVAGKFRRMIFVNDPGSASVHYEAGTSHITRDTAAVQKCLEEIATKMVNPFMNPPDELISISTGIHTSQETQKDLTCVKEIGERALQ